MAQNQTIMDLDYPIYYNQSIKQKQALGTSQEISDNQSLPTPIHQ